MSTDLKPCPFCGGSNITLATYDVQPDNYHAGHAYCNDCGMEGPSSLSLPEPDGHWMPDADSAKEEGAKAWNRRSDASLADAQAEIARLRGALEEINRTTFDDDANRIAHSALQK